VLHHRDAVSRENDVRARGGDRLERLVGQLRLVVRRVEEDRAKRAEAGGRRGIPEPAEDVGDNDPRPRVEQARGAQVPLDEPGDGGLALDEDRQPRAA